MGSDDGNPQLACEVKTMVHQNKEMVDGRTQRSAKEIGKGIIQARLGSRKGSQVQPKKRDQKSKEEVLESVSTESERKRYMGGKEIHNE